MKRVAVINVVGLSQDLIGEHTPNISAFASNSSVQQFLSSLPAVTCTVQSSILTGSEPSEHGIVANGWHDRVTKETSFWKQSNALVHGTKIWDTLKATQPEATVANMFWWFNMYSSVDIAVTPRPQYRSNGRKVPDIWTTPTHLRQTLQDKHGQFPLFKFWGPGAGIESSEWITNATLDVEHEFEPTLTFVYLPHLDYPLQRVGPDHKSIPHELKAIDAQVGRLLETYDRNGVQCCIMSEYGIEPAHQPVHINKILRESGYLSIREEAGREYLDAGVSKAFAVPDHQIAHIYVREDVKIEPVIALLENENGIEFVLTGEGRGHLNHERSGEIIVVASKGAWFTHDWWMQDQKAPDYQRTVDIHKKPGYDPRELHLASGWRGSKFRIAFLLLLKKCGYNKQLDVITLDAAKVKGTHGRTPEQGAPSPVFITPNDAKKVPKHLPASALNKYILELVSS